MRSRISRHLGPILDDEPSLLGGALLAIRADPAAEDQAIKEEFNGTEYARFLLYIAAGIEHALMVQYLFAAYSLGGPDVPERLRNDVRAWQETIFGIAKEEMAHLITVQNLLTALGAPLNFDRDDYPFDTPFYPFQFRLVAASRESLAAYVCAESPADWDKEEAERISRIAESMTGVPINRVGKLYAEIITLLGDELLVPDDAFDRGSVAFQASWDEWGRGYRDGARDAEFAATLELPAPELLILQAGSREEVIAALQEVGEQGEGPNRPERDEDSHFGRFLAIFSEIEQLGDDADQIVRQLVPNPTTEQPSPGSQPRPNPNELGTSTPLTDPTARVWAHLFNLRYRMLLLDISHAFELADVSNAGPLNARGALIHRSFAEMYNLRALAGMLVALPADAEDPDGWRAAPPFQMPYTLKLPRDENDRWRLHRDLVDASGQLIERLKPLAGADGRAYLAALEDADAREREHLELLIAGSARTAAANGGAPS